jgi:membrane protease YdiL (CAAX protease family)
VTEEQAAEPRSIRWGMGDAAFGWVLSIIFSVVGVGVFAAAMGEDDFDDIELWATAILQVPLWVGLLGVPVWASVHKGLGRLRDDFGLAMQPRDIPIGLGAGFAAQIVIGLVAVWVYELLGVDADRLGETAEELADRAVGGIDVVLLVLIVAVGAPIVEEIFYRGLLMRSMARRWGMAVAVVASSLVFGLAHFQPYDLIALAPAGLVFAWLATRFGRLGPAIWAHVAFNLTAVIALLSS